MKKFVYILFIALLGATACSMNEIGQPEPMDGNGKVTFVMGLEFPEVFPATRAAMSHVPAIENVYVAVFGGQGYINDYVKAVPCNAQGVEQESFSDMNIQNGQLFYYKVTLLATTGSRTVHVIANGPSEIQYNTYDYEVMPNLTTDAGNGAYWTAFSLPKGTSEKNASGYDVPSGEAVEAFSNLKLIRNFAEINVIDNASNFELVGFKVFNTPDKGRVVTWKDDYQAGTTANPRLDGYYTPYYGMSFQELQTADYTPTLAEGAVIDPAVPSTSSDYALGPQFVFEREWTKETDRPYIILKGIYTNTAVSPAATTTCYYRLDFTDIEGNYIPIFRNFRYDITIDAVAKVGVSDPSTAQASNVNVSATLETKDLTDLADGESRIIVQYLDKTFVKSEPIQFQYLFLPGAGDAIAEDNVESASFRLATDDEIEEAGRSANTTDQAFTVSGISNYTVDQDWGTTWNDDDNWQEVTLNIAASGNTEKRTTFRISGITPLGHTIYRYVTIRVLKMQTFAASLDSSPGHDIGSVVTVNLNLEPNLPPSIFPLQIAFEDSNKRLNPNGIDMPAKVGTSIVPEHSDRSYQFVKSISYSEYINTSYKVPCEFKRISMGDTVLYMKNEYFEGIGTLSIPQ